MAFGHFLESFSGRIQDERKREYERVQKMDEREFQLLDTLARFGTPEVQAIAGTALAEMAAGKKGGPKQSQGLKGFLGQMERSSYFPAVNEFIANQQRETPPAPARPGSAALPAGSPVEPGGPQMPPGAAGQRAPSVERAIGTTGPQPQPVPIPSAPPGPLPIEPIPGASPFAPTITPMPSQQPLESRSTTGFGAPPEPVLPSAPGPGMRPIQQAMAAPPEPKMRRLFPTAEELATTQARAGVIGRGEAISQQILAAGGTQQDVIAALRGAAGAPMRYGSGVPMMITYIDQATGEQKQGLGTYDPATRTYEVGGVPVQGLNAQRIPSTTPRGPGWQLRQDETGQWVWFQQPQPGAPAPTTPIAGTQPGAPGTAGTPLTAPPEPPSDMSVTVTAPAPPTIGTGVKGMPRAESPDFAGTSEIQTPGGPQIVQNPRVEGGPTRVVGPAVVTPGATKNTEEARIAHGHVVEIEKRVSTLTKPVPGARGKAARPKARTKELLDQVTREVLRERTGQDHPNATYAEWTERAAGVMREQTRSGVSREEASRIIDQLNALTQRQQHGVAPAPGSVVRGSGIPPEPQ